MGRQMVFPYNTWNYAHNRNYLSYAQEQLGLPTEAIRGARELLAVPLDPKLNVATRMSPHWQGVSALPRALVKFERWDEILKEDSIPWGDSLRDRVGRRYAEAMAHLGKRDRRGGNEGRRRSRRAQGDVEKDSNSTDEASVRGAGPRAARLAVAAQGRRDRRADTADPGGAEGAGAIAPTTTIRRPTPR